MGRRFWLAFALALTTAAALATGSAATPEPAGADPRPRSVLQGLDYIHARQQSDASFGSMPNTAWALLAIAGSGERQQAKAWTVSGVTPFAYLDSRSHESAATDSDVDNAPVYYARTILAYVAAGQKSRVFIAGRPRVDLLAQLYAYQEMNEGPSQGAFSPSTSNRDYQAVRTTTWAILAMHTMGEAAKDRFTRAVAWLAAQQRSDGGFPSEPTIGESSNALDTALAIQALMTAPSVDPAAMAAARLYLKSQQRSDGGFPSSPNGGTDAQATSAAIQAILALGERPSDTYWKIDERSAPDALRRLQQENGSFARRPGSTLQLLPTTAWALIALREHAFTTFPAKIGATLDPFVAPPRITSVSPTNKATLKQSHAVEIRASYNDGADGTGIKVSACRVSVDGVDKTRSANMGERALRLRLTVANGSHTFKLQIGDRAGNVSQVQRTFTVAVPVRPTPTYPPPATVPAYPHPTYAPRPTPTPQTPAPVTTLTPTPVSPGAPTPWGSPSPSGTPIVGPVVASPSPDASSTATTPSDGAAAYLGGTLLAMLPVGVILGYLFHRHRVAELEPAQHGRTLPSHGSGWQQVTRILGAGKGRDGEG